MTLTKLPNATTSLHHHLLWHRHHNAKEVRIFKRLEDDRIWMLSHTFTLIFQMCSGSWTRHDEEATVSYRGRQTEDRLLSHQAFSKLHITIKVRKVVHFNPHLVKFTERNTGNLNVRHL